jgi:putative transposase
MGRIIQPLLFMLAQCSRNHLIRQIEFLKAENEILRKRVKSEFIKMRPEERHRLLELGKAIGPALRHIITVVSYNSYLRWVRDEKQEKPKPRWGRPPKGDDLRDLVVKIARETGWGYTRVLGELRKLGIGNVSRQTVVNILKAHGLEPGPKRGPGTWDEFLKRHAETLWQCDFFSKRIITRFGLRRIYVLVLLNVATRRVWVSPATRHPVAPWMDKQAEAFLTHVDRTEAPPVQILTRDNDVKYEPSFDALLTAQGCRVKKLAMRAPNTNAYVERFIQSLQVECLDHFLVFGEKHFDYLVREYVEHYLTERPHQGLANRLVIDRPPPDSTSDPQCHSRLGGVLKHYARAA